jgi:hypothetical protein
MDDKQYMLQCLGGYARQAHNDSLGKGVTSKPRMLELLASDSRFAGFDHSALADAADAWHRSGPRPDLDDPRLRGQPAWSRRI